MAGAVAMSSFLVPIMLLLFGYRAFTADAAMLQITPDTDNITSFQGQEFRKLCTVTELGADMEVTYLWERNGLYIDSRSGGANLQLHIPNIDLLHVGHYTCTANITSSQAGGNDVITTTLGPISAGYLNVLDRSLISAPSSQFLLEGSSSSLLCSFPGSLITWQTVENPVFTGSFSPVRYSDEGDYECDIYVPTQHTSIQVSISLYVIVLVEIVSTSVPVYQNLSSNLPVTLSVSYRGRGSHDLSVDWMLNGLPLSSSEEVAITTTYDAAMAEGRTELVMAQTMRAAAGLYVVVIRSQAGEIYSSQQRVTFQIDVTVLPAVPAHLQVNHVSATSGHISWQLNSSTTDERPDSLILRVEKDHSLVREVTLPGDQTDMILEDLIPSEEYSILLTAVNIDGRVSTGPVLFTTSEGAPLIQTLAIERVNRTVFEMTISLAYTGGGSITTLTLAYQQTNQEGVVPHIKGEGLVLSTVVMISEDMGYTDLQFTVSVTNEFGYQSLNASASVSAFPTDMDPTSSPTASGSTLADLLPVWLIAVIASVITILVMIFILGVCVAIHYCCCHKKKSDKFKVSSHPPSPDYLGSHDNQILPDKHDGGGGEHPYTNTSIMSSQLSDTSLDTTHKHKRVPSDSSSIATSVVKATITPSTTASNSPSNLVKSHYLSSEVQLGSIMEMEGSVPHSDDSATESEVDRVRLQNQLNQKRMDMSPYSQHDRITPPRLCRGSADGSTCSHHHSLSGSQQHVMMSGSQPFYLTSHHSLNQPPSSQQQQQLNPHMFNYSDPKHLNHHHHHPHSHSHSGERPPAEFKYHQDSSDHDSMVSDVSYSSSSIPSRMIKYYHKLPRGSSSITSTPSTTNTTSHYRSPTPYNHEFDLEGSIV